MKCFTLFLTRFLVLAGCLVLVACGGDDQDITCKDCSSVAKIKKVQRPRSSTSKVELDGTDSMPGLNGGDLFYNWILLSKPEESNAQIIDPDKPVANITPDKPGVYCVQLIVNDGVTTSKPCIVNIQTLDERPVAIPKIVKPVRLNEKLELDGSESTPGFDARILSFRWTFSKKPDGSNAKLFNSDTDTPYFYPDIKDLYEIQLIVNDENYDSEPATVEFTPLNTVPDARVVCKTCYDNNSVRVSDTVLLDATDSDDFDKDPLTYKWKIMHRPKNSSANLSDTEAITPSFIADRSGEFVVQLIVNDGQIDSEPLDMAIQVHDNPIAKATYEQQLPVQQVVQLDGSQSSPGDDGIDLFFQWILKQKPDGSTASLSEPTSDRPVFFADKAGKYIIQLIVNDNISSSNPFILEYEPLNSMPIAKFECISPIQVNQFARLDASKSSDLDNDPLTYKWRITNRPGGSSAQISNANSMTPSFTADSPGQYTIQLIVNDGQMNSDPFELGVQVYDNPTAKAIFLEQRPVQQVVQLDGSASRPCIGGGQLTFLWTLEQKPSGSSATLSDPTSVKPSFLADKPGKYIFKLIVTDDLSTSPPFMLEYNTLNSKPIANCEVNLPIYVNRVVELDASKSSDLDNDPLTYQWKITNRPNGSSANLSNASGINPSFIADRAGRYTVQLVVNDGKMNSDPFDLNINVNDNVKPVAKIEIVRPVKLKEKLELDGSKSTTGSNVATLTFSWKFNQKPKGSNAILYDSDKAKPYFYPDIKDVYEIQLIVHDGFSESRPAIIVFTPLNSRPIANASYNDPIRINETVFLTATQSDDVDNDPLTCRWKMIYRPQTSSATLSDVNAITPSFLADRMGKYILQVVVNDGQIDSEPFVLYINVHDNPAAKVTIEQQLPIQQVVQLDGSESRPSAGGGKLTFQWTLKQKPSGSSAILSDPTSEKPTFFADKPGTYVIQLIVNDGVSSSSPFILEYKTLNSKPVAQFDFNRPIYVNQPVVLDASNSSDLDNDPLTFKWIIMDRPNGSSAQLSDASAISPSFIADRQGEYIVRLVVNDGKIDSEPFDLNINDIHVKPVAKVEIVRPVKLNEKMEMDGSKSTPGTNASTLTFSWKFNKKPIGSKAILYNSDKANPYFYPDIKELYEIQLIVNDGLNESPPAIIAFTPLNTRPVARASYNDPIRINETVILSAAQSDDVDNDPLSCRWKMIYHPQDSSAVLSDVNAISPTFVADRKGKYIVQVIVNDGQIDSEPFVLYINVHDNPSAKASVEQQLPVRQIVQLDGSGSRPSVGGGNLTFLWTLKQKPSGSNASLSDPTSAKPTFLADKPGTYVIQLIVNDGISSSSPFILEYKTQNSKPLARCDYNRPIFVNQTVELDATASSDLDNDPLTYEWNLSFKPLNSNASLSNTNGSKSNFLADLPGKYVVQLVVNDGHENSDIYTLIVNTKNSKPIAKAGEDVTVFEGETVQLDGSQSMDADGSSLTYKWSVNEKPNGSTAQLSSVNKINPVFIPDVPGLYEIQLIVNDGEMDSDPDTLDIIANASVDLKPGKIDLSQIETDPETLIVSGVVYVDIINTGTRPIPGEFQVILFEDVNQNNQYDPSDKPLAIDTIVNGPQGNDAITVEVKAGYVDDKPLINPQVSFLDNAIFVMIDPMDTIPERDETNNIANSLDGILCKPPVNDFSPRLAWSWTESRNNEFPASNQVVCTPVIGNLTDDNNDGQIDLKDIPDIVFITFEGSDDEKNGVIRAISGDGSADHFSIGPFSHNGRQFEAFPNYNPALGDIDNDGLIEILVVVKDQEANKWLAVFENNGTLKWISHDYSSSQMDSPASVNIADLDANGAPEIIIGHYVLSNTGQTLMIGKEDNGLNNANVADIDLDSQMEIIAGRTAYEANGKVLWHVYALREGYNAIANFDNDEYPEIVLVGMGRVTLVEHTGEIIWGPKEIAPGGPFRGEGGPPMISDVDGDGQLEIGIAGASKFSLFNGNGSLDWTADIKDPSSVTSASAFDFDGDGSSEIVYRDSVSLKIFNGRNGNILYEDPSGSSTFIEMPVVADVDNDNSAEIVVPCNSYISGNVTGIRVYEDAKDHWVNTRKIWNQHAYVTTNIYEDGRIPQKPINNWDLYNNFRQNQMEDPFGCKDVSSSYIRFDLSDCPNSVKITARIGNASNLHVPAGTQVSFYLGNPAGSGRLLAEKTIDNPIRPGQWIDLSISMKNPGTQIINIFVVADSNNTLWESNEDNNTSQHSFTCTSQ
jgi:hypothetical protein